MPETFINSVNSLMVQPGTQMSMIGANHYLALSTVLFVIGMLGVLLKKNVIVMLMGVELMLNAVNVAILAFAKYRGDVSGQILVFFVMTVAAAEAGVGLALAVSVFKRFKELNIKNFEQLKG
jgi:NADH-quinone oxidoreductase subunit K